MGKSEKSNPIEKHRKAERKKEITKNKKQRIQSRDLKVIETRTSKSIKDEISTLQSQKKTNLNNSTEKKIERLQKELKLVVTAEEEKRKNAALSGLVVPQREHERFDYDVRISYYYDPVYNPYGVAPPGTQILYHGDNDGGATKNRRHGIVPQKYLTTHEKIAIEEMQINHDHGSDDDMQEEEQQKEVVPPPPPSKPPKEESNNIPPPPPPPPLPITKVNLNAKPPPPSSSVQRLLKSKHYKNNSKQQQFDIWASNDEIQINSNIEGNTRTSSKSSNKKNVNNDNHTQLLDVWYYMDNTPQRNVQGPYTTDIMKSWFLSGFFPNTTPIKRGSLNSNNNDNDIFKPIGNVTYFQKLLKPEKSKWKMKEEHSKEENKEEEDILQARIDALLGKSNDDCQGLNVGDNEKLPPPPLPQSDLPLPPPPPQPNALLMSDIPAYPINDDENEIPSYPLPEEEQENNSKLKSYQGEKDIVSLIPHKLRKKR